MRCRQFFLMPSVVLLLVAQYALARADGTPAAHAGDKAIRACLCAIIDDLEKLKPQCPELCEFDAERLKARVELGTNFSSAVLEALRKDSPAPSKTGVEDAGPQENSELPLKWSRGFDYQHNFTEGSPKYVARKPAFGKDGCRFFVRFNDINAPTQLVARGTIPTLNAQYFSGIQLPSDGSQELRTKFDEIVLRHIHELEQAAAGYSHGRVQSPGGKNLLKLSCTGGRAGTLDVEVSRDGRPVMEIASFKVTLKEIGELSGTSTLENIEHSTVNETFVLPWGKTREIINRCERATCHFTNPEGIRWELDLAAYEDGVAFRYRLPEQEKLTRFSLTSESEDLSFSGVPLLHYTSWDSFKNDHESEFHQDPLTGVRGPLVDMPLLAVWPNGLAAGITEARIRDFSSLYLSPDANPDLGLFHMRLSSPPDKEKPCVTGCTPHASPWRVILLAENAGKLLESNLLVCLNDPPSGDFSWAKPGKTTWHWWNGTFDRGPAFVPGMNLETHKRYIDFCAKNGIAYHAVIADTHPWHVQSEEGFTPQKDTDILSPRPELNLPEILKYAKEKGVGIRLWLHWKALDPKLEEAFQQYEDWGISGLMIDFLDRDDQEVVNFCERALESAARHKLHIQFHGSYKPGGEQRTFPNLFNREGVLNLEYLKWSKRCTPAHNVEAAYVRQLAGPLDYHTGGFNAISDRAFVPRNENPYVLGSRCHHLAMFVVFDNPMPMVADTPEAYEGQDGFDFIIKVPTTWDESHFVTGEAGGYIVMARRNGNIWYLGGMTNWTPREIKLPFDFLPQGRYDVRLYIDASMDGENPNAIRMETETVESGASLPVAMAPGGGFTAIVTPIAK